MGSKVGFYAQKQAFCKHSAFSVPLPSPPGGGDTFPRGEGFAAAPLPQKDFFDSLNPCREDFFLAGIVCYAMCGKVLPGEISKSGPDI